MERANNGRIFTKPDIFTKGNVIQWFVMLCFILHLGAAAEIVGSTLSGQNDAV
jgi:hypothetical protein